jgi:hypothetical protein
MCIWATPEFLPRGGSFPREEISTFKFQAFKNIFTLLKQRIILRCIKAQRLAWLGRLERMHEEGTIKK